MTYELESALDNLFRILRIECEDSEVVAVDVTFTAQGSEINYRTRTAASLKRDCISMQNICGKFIN